MKVATMFKVTRVLEKYSGKDSREDGGRKMAAANIKLLLSAIDFNAEVVPENNKDMLTGLIISQKGKFAVHPAGLVVVGDRNNL